MRGADAVAAGVAAADHDHVLAGGEDRAVVEHVVARDAPVLLRQELHGEVHARELAARDRQIARHARADREHDRIEVARSCRP